jgi:anti-sigma regulatory factor (Ser/Thr protein kinase)
MPVPAEAGELAGAVVVILPQAPASARLAREHVRSVTGLPEDPRVALVVTELVINAVVHGRSRPRLRAAMDGELLHVEVHDDGPGWPRLTPLSDAPTTSGRGLALVDHVAQRWGVRQTSGGGKAVWAVIAPETADAAGHPS